jgi:hypothetical protein
MNAGPINLPPVPGPGSRDEHEFVRPAVSAGPPPTAHPSTDAWPAARPGSEDDQG